MKFEALKPGMTLYDVHSYRMGNTRLRTLGVWLVRVIEVNADRTILASWNGNKPVLMRERQWKKLRVKQPEMERDSMGRQRLKRRSVSAGDGQ